MKISEAIRIVRPEYVFLKLKPNNSIRNNNTHKIARAIASIYKNVLENVKKEEVRATRILGKQFFIPIKVSIEAQSKVSYFIYIEKKKVEFYFIIPKQHMSVIKEKIGDVWTSITAEVVENLPEFGQDATRYQLAYTKEDALSLNVDRRDSDLLRSTLNVVDVMEDGDRAGVFYNFIPTSQFTWRSTYKHTIEKVRKKSPVDRNKMGSSYMLKLAFSFLVGTVDAVTSVFSNPKKLNGESPLESLLERLNGGIKISDSTQKKATANILDTQIIVMSKSMDALRQRNNAKSLARTFDTITEDNELTHRSYKGEFKYTDRVLRGASINKISDGECQSFISMAGRDLLEQHNFIERVETQETEVPEDLQEGVMCVGANRFRGNDQIAYLSTDKEYKNLPLILIGPQRAGKSTLIANLANDGINNGECVFIFDFIASCQLSSEVAALFPTSQRLIIDCEDPNKIQGLGYNEIGVSADPFRAYDNAKKQTTQLMSLINSVNADDTRLTAKMERYLTSAALVVFITGGSIRDVFAVLQDEEDRGQFINRVPAAQQENLSEHISNLCELNDYKEVKVKVTEGEGKKAKTVTKTTMELCGTKDHLITGVIDRLNKLKANTYMEAMLKKSTAGNINLVKEMQKNQLIILKMPESMFSTDGERDIYTIYWMTKIWLSAQIREQQVGGDRSKLTKVNLIIDELYQVENTQKFLNEKLSRLAKFGVKPILSAHYLLQIKHIREELRSANASYMLISGCDKDNYKELKSELHPFTEEDLLKLPRYHSMNLLKNKDGYARFITKLPKPI